ncbi:MAG: apolipoprotein N-acyltransferase [Clostridia bacterium]|nr:apolipoprotein N-acyltransferase [Clostridia bacterium]
MAIIFSILSGVLSGLAFITENAWPLLLFAPGLFYFSLYDEKRPFFKGFVFGTFFYMFNSVYLSSFDISFITPNLFYQKLFPFLAYLLLSAAEGLFTALFAKLFVMAKKKTFSGFHPLLFSSLWVIYEYLIALPDFFTGYPFGRISIPFAACPYFIQSASLFGSLFISFIVIYFASSFSMCFLRKSIRPMLFPLILLMANTFVSAYLYTIPEEGEAVTVKVVQNGYGGYDKWLTPPNIIVEDSINEISDAEIVLFAESAIPLHLNKNTALETLSDAAKENNVTVLLGSLFSDSDGKRYTSVYLLPYVDGEIYHKRHPVPYGEYYPIFDIFSSEAREAGLSKGKVPKLLSDYSLGPVICFDSMFPSYSREAVKEGARLLCVSTNDSWFSKGNAARLHLYHSVYRSVENGRYVARSACTGISAFIDTKGNIISSIPLNDSGTIKGELLLTDEITPYTMWGDIPVLIYSIVSILISLLRKKREKQNV